ncbi:hypothetical protein ACOME3_010703 [Neoechinorhynchus agilis]
MRRNYDRESGTNRVTPSNPEDPETAVARLTVVEKPYMGDKQRPIFDKTEMTQTKDSETTKTLEPRTVRDTEQDQKSAKSAHFKVAPQYTLLTAFDIFRMARPTLKVANEFVPSTFELYNLLHGLHTAVVGNTKIQHYFKGKTEISHNFKILLTCIETLPFVLGTNVNDFPPSPKSLDSPENKTERREECGCSALESGRRFGSYEKTTEFGFMRLRYSSWRTGVLLKRKIDTKDPASTMNSTEAVSIETSTNYGSKQEANDVIDIADIKRKKFAGGRKRSISDSDEHSIRSKRRVSQSSADHQTELNASLKTQIIKEEDEHMKSRKRSNEDIGFRKRSNQMAQTTDSETREQSPRRKRVAVDPKSADFKSKRKIDALAEKPNPSILDSSNEEVNQPTGLSEGFSVDVPFIYRLRYDRDRRKINEIRQNIKDLCPESHGRGFIGSQPVSMTLNNIQTLRQLDYRVSWKDDGTRYLCLIRAKNEIYMIDRRNSIFKVRNLTFVTKRGTKDHLRQTLLDGEMVEDVVEGKRIPRFLIFDVLAFNGHPAGKELDFDKRLELILREIILPRHRAMECGAIDRSREPFGIRRKDFYGLKHSKHLLNEKFKRELPHETDGLIFQPVYMPYIFGTFYELLKYKPTRLNSVDFKLVIPGHDMEKRKIGSG